MNTSSELWRRAILPERSTIQDAIKNLNEVAIKIVLVVNDIGEFVGTISDGDIRRALLRGLSLDSAIATVIRRDAFVVPHGISRDTAVKLMLINKIQQIPVVDEQKKVIGLHLWDEMNVSTERPNLMVIMAGGRGTRMMPFTENCPKPMIEVSGKPMLLHIIERAAAEGFRKFIISVHYLGDQIERYFGTGERFGVKIEYLKENSPLGTAGALGLMSPFPEYPFIVTNGDVLTDVRYGELLDFHVRHEAVATMAVRVHEWQHPYGVVNLRGIEISGFEEKPLVRKHINAGVYALSPTALKYLNSGERFDMPTLFENIRLNKLRTIAYPMHEPWLDVGRPSDLEVANNTHQ